MGNTTGQYVRYIINTHIYIYIYIYIYIDILGIASYPGSLWAGRKEPGIHCSRMRTIIIHCRMLVQALVGGIICIPMIDTVTYVSASVLVLV